MKSEGLDIFTEKQFPMGSLIVVSNREPYVHKKSGASLKVERPAGGLASAMNAVLEATGGTWIAWGAGSGDRDVVDSRNSLAVPPDNPSYTLKRVWLSPSEADNYYHGYSNRVLWPLCHIILDRVYFRKRFWQDYVKVNQSFASAVLEETADDSVVWIHDYHLCLLPKMLREALPGLTIAHFWHIPWPSWSVFRVCPQSKEIIEGLLANDLIGFQIPLFVKNFLDCAKECLGADVDYRKSTIHCGERTIRLKAFPISIDYDKFNSLAASERASRMIKHTRDRYGITHGFLGLGVDRLEYTKALIKRLQAIELLFQRYGRFIRKFTFIQIAVPTRMKEPYISYKKAVEELILKINEKYSVGDWKPIIYIDTKIEHKDLVAFYRMADVAIISSVYDGMNLVAKEYVASKIDGTGALILSEFAGAAEEMDGAILVNPYDLEEFSDCIKRALVMSQDEKTGRMEGLRRQVRGNDIYKWICDILAETFTISQSKNKETFYFFDHVNEFKERVSSNIFLCLDFDGTLAPIAESPDKARLSVDIYSLLTEFREYIPLAVISGRRLQDLRERVGIEHIIYAGNHGAEIWNGAEMVISQQSSICRPSLNGFLEKLKNAVSHIQGVLIEDNGTTASVHFRMVKIQYIKEFFDIFQRIARDYKNTFRITRGKKVLEIRPVEAWNKGDALSWIFENMGKGRIPVYVGDGTTDDAFRAIRGEGVSICVGEDPEADYYLKDQGEVKEFLIWIKKVFG